MVKKTEKVKKIIVKKEQKEPKEKVRKYNIFDFINKIFFDYEEALKVSRIEKNSYSFILNRFMSIEFPLVAFQLSRIGINISEQVNYWIIMLSKKYNKKPYFFSVIWKTKQNKDTQKTKEWKPENETKEKYLQIYKIDDKIYNETMQFFKDEFIEELKNFEKMLKSKGVK